MGSTTYTGGGLYTSLPCCRCKYFRVIGRGTGREDLKTALTNPSVDAVYLCWRDIYKDPTKINNLIYNSKDFIIMKRALDPYGDLQDILQGKGRKILEEGCIYVD